MTRFAARAVLLAALGAQAQVPTFQARVEAVYADVAVSRDGRPVAQLTAAAFELKDDGVRQQVELVDATTVPLLAVLVFDTSRSTAGEKLLALREAGGAFLDGLRPDDRATLVTFSEEVAWPAPPTSDKTAVRASLGRLRADGATSVLDALYAGVTLSQGGARSLVVLFSDGIDNMSWLDARQVELAARRSNTLVHVVGWKAGGDVSGAGLVAEDLAESLHVRALRRIAEATGGRFWPADSPARLRAAFASIADSLGHRYLLRYEPTGVKRAGWHRIDVRLLGSKGDVQARPGYWIPAERTGRP